MAFPPYLAVLPVTFKIGLDWSTLVPKRSSCRTETSEPCLPTDYFYPCLLSPTSPHITYLPIFTGRSLSTSYSPCDCHCTRPRPSLRLTSLCFVLSRSSTCRRDALVEADIYITTQCPRAHSRYQPFTACFTSIVTQQVYQA